MVDESNISECEMIDPAMNHIKESVCKKNQVIIKKKKKKEGIYVPLNWIMF